MMSSSLRCSPSYACTTIAKAWRAQTKQKGILEEAFASSQKQHEQDKHGSLEKGKARQIQ